MRIQHNIMAMNAYRNFGNNTSALNKNLEKLSSGYRINRAGDDAAGLAISEKMRAQITGLDAAQKNVQDGISLIKTAEGACQEIHDMLNRMVYLATQSANGTYSDTDRGYLQKEVESLRTEIKRIVSNVNFNGIKLLNGSLSSRKLQIGDSAVEILNLTGATSLSIGALGITSLSVGTSSAATSAIGMLKDPGGAIDVVNNLRAQLGAYQNRLEHTANNLSVMEENIQNAESAIRDTDIADEMTAYTKNNILIQSAQAMLAQANQVPQGVLQLLQ